MRGLRWLAEVGPAPVEVWGLALGWARPTVYEHALRLERAGLLERVAMVRGTGSLVWASRAGVQLSGAEASPLARPPAPLTWGHLVGVAWVAAWLTVRGRVVTGARELLVDQTWRGQLEWTEHGGVRRRGHRPDLLAGVAESGGRLPIEVELASKSTARLRAILALYAAWVHSGRTNAVVYVCSSERNAARVRELAAAVGLVDVGSSTRLRVELLADVITQTRTVIVHQ